jgi:hypothetical protein
MWSFTLDRNYSWQKPNELGKSKFIAVISILETFYHWRLISSQGLRNVLKILRLNQALSLSFKVKMHVCI